MNESQDTLKRELLDAEYRYAYAEDFLNTLIATQIRVLREQRGMSQGQLAELVGTQQPGIARLENVNYSVWKTETLRKLARALQVRLRITFEDFTSLLNDGAGFSRDSLERVAFADDPTFQPIRFRRRNKLRHRRILRTTDVVATANQEPSEALTWNEYRATSPLGQLAFSFDPRPPSKPSFTNVLAFQIPIGSNIPESVNPISPLGGTDYGRQAAGA